MSLILDRLNSDEALAALPLEATQAQHVAAQTPVLSTPAGLAVVATMAASAAAAVAVTWAVGGHQKRPH